MTVEEYRQRMIDAFHKADCDELIALVVMPTEKEFEQLEGLLKTHYKKQPCGDAVSREAVLEVVNNPLNIRLDKIIEGLPPVTPKPTECEDAVSREAVLGYVHRILNQGTGKNKSFEFIQKYVERLPSVTPKQRTGHWVEIGDEPYDTWECDNCGFVIDGSGCVDPEEYRDIYKYCPNCGAKMEGESE